MLAITIAIIHVTSNHHFSDQCSFLHHSNLGPRKTFAAGGLLFSAGREEVQVGESGLVILTVPCPVSLVFLIWPIRENISLIHFL